MVTAECGVVQRRSTDHGVTWFWRLYNNSMPPARTCVTWKPPIATVQDPYVSEIADIKRLRKRHSLHSVFDGCRHVERRHQLFQRQAELSALQNQNNHLRQRAGRSILQKLFQVRKPFLFLAAPNQQDA